MNQQLRRERKGASALEYALLAGLIILVVFGGLLALRGAVSGNYTLVADQVEEATAPEGSP